MNAEPQVKEPERIGPYALYDEIGCGGMATVHLGQLRGDSGFSRIVAIKRMHAELARSPEFVAMFLEEARLAGRIQHPNVVAALDWVAADGSAFLVMEYVHGVSLDQALRQLAKNGESVSLSIASAVVIGALMGLHAAHEAVDENGKNLDIVHRDVSPHNVLVGVDGLSRVLDFGIAKAAERAHHTRTGEVKGKLGYMAPEQLFHDTVGREADIYSVGVMLWELVTGRRLFANESQGQMLMRIANNQIEPPRSVRPDLDTAIDALTMKALAQLPDDRYRTALEFAIELERVIPPASQRVVGDWLSEVANEALHRRSELKLRIETSTTGKIRDPSLPEATVTSRFRHPTPTPSSRSDAAISTPVTPQPRRRSWVLPALGVAVAGAVTVGVLWPHTPWARAAHAGPVGSGSASAHPTTTTVATAPPHPSATETASASAAPAESASAAASVDASSGTVAVTGRPDPRVYRGYVAPPRPRTPSSAVPAASSAPAQGSGSELDQIGGRE